MKRDGFLGQSSEATSRVWYFVGAPKSWKDGCMLDGQMNVCVGKCMGDG